MYIDIHSHHPASQGQRVIQNGQEVDLIMDAGGWYSLGVHPWLIIGDGGHQLAKLAPLLCLPQVLAIGECGLDRVCATPMAVQVEVFRQQISMAALHQKPLIIHCVKAWEETIQLLKEERTQVPVIFHGYTKSLLLAQRLLHEGYYLSFGRALEQERVQRILQQVAPDRFFLETDNSLVGIATRYEIAAKALGIGVNSLSLQLQKNAEKVFGIGFINL